MKAKDEAEAAKKKSDDEKAAAMKAYADETARLTAQTNKDLKDQVGEKTSVVV